MWSLTWGLKLMGAVAIPLAILAVLLWFIGSWGNKQWLMERAEVKWNKQGFEVVDYEGFQLGCGGWGTPYGGAKVHHRLRKVPDNGITYSGFLVRWGDEVQVYGPKAVDAIAP